MSHFAKVINGIVTEVLVIEQDVIDAGVVGDPAQWIQTSYNTYHNQHRLGGTPLRGNYAGIGYIYDSVNDVFYPPKPFPSWQLNTSTWIWEAPIPYPQDGNRWDWDESAQQWIPLQSLGI